MIVIPRGLARAFRALLRKCVSGRPRGPAPAVVFESTGGTLTIHVRTADAVLVHAAPARGGDGVLVVPMAALDAADGAGDDPVELAVGPKLTGEVRWTGRGEPRTYPFAAIPPGRQHRPPDPPADWQPVGPGFLAALHECGRTTARDAGRYALTRVQLRGAAGEAVGTDGRTALVWAGFGFPFAADLLVPAVPVFAARELAAGGGVRVGRTPTHLAVAAGPWAVYLAVDPAGRYPDVAGLLARLPALPGADAADRPVTLAVGRGVAVLARDAATGRVETVRLPRSTATGPPARVAVDRRVLARALALGCHAVRVAPGRPVALAGGGKTLVTVALDPAPAAEPDAAPTDPPTPPERRTVMKHVPNGHPPDPPSADPPDLLAAAEDLRAAVADALAKAGRLVAALKSRKREQRVLGQVWSSLKALNLGPGGGP